MSTSKLVVPKLRMATHDVQRLRLFNNGVLLRCAESRDRFVAGKVFGVQYTTGASLRQAVLFVKVEAALRVRVGASEQVRVTLTVLPQAEAAAYEVRS